MTTTPPTADGDLMELVRGADPLKDHVNPAADEAAESLLAEILAAPRPKRSPRTRPSTKAVVRLAAVGAAFASAFVAITAITGDGRGGAVAPASAAVVQHALAAAAQPPGTILHVDMRGTQNNGDGTTITWRDQSWQENSAPYDRRQVETNPDGTTVESGNVGDSEQVYDSASNTIYASGSTPPGAKPKALTSLVGRFFSEQASILPGGRLRGGRKRCPLRPLTSWAARPESRPAECHGSSRRAFQRDQG